MGYLKKTCAVALSAAMVMGMAAGAGNVSMAASGIEKEETVYVNQESDGKVSDVTVSDWLKNVSGSGDVSDKSNLTDIKNVKGNEEFKQGSDGELTWKAENTDIYYQGKSDEELPVSVKITYKLDGKSVKPSEMAGKSGKMEMAIQYGNSAEYEDKIEGVTTKMSTPFLMASAVILPVDNFSNVEISQGKIVSEGSNQILVAYGVPGLSQSLNLSGDLKDKMEDKLGDVVTITADVKDFSMGPVYTVASSDEFSGIELDDDSDINDLEDAVNDLVDATDELISGSSDLSDGLSALQGNFKSYADGVKKVDKGAADLSSGAGKLASGVSQYTDGVKTLTNGAGQYVTGTNKLADGVNSYVDGEKLIEQGAKTLKDESAALPEGYSRFSEGLLTYINGVNQIADISSVQSLANGSQAVADGIKGINSALGAVDMGSVDYNAAISTLETVKEGMGDGEEDAKQQIEGVINQLKTAQSAQSAAAAAISALREKTSSESELLAGARQIAGAMNELNQKAPAIAAGGEDLKSGDKEMSAGIKGITDGIATLYSGIQNLSSNNEALVSGANELKAKGIDLTSGIAAIDKNTSSLTSSAKKLSKGADTLHGGTKDLTGATKKVSDGVNKLQSGSVDLLEGMGRFKSEGTGKLQNEYNENIKNVLDRFQSLTGDKAGYKTFSGIADGMGGKVKFIFQTAEISSDEK